LRRAERAVLESHVFLSLCAAALCWETSVLLRTPVHAIGFYGFVFYATLAVYNIHAIARGRAKPMMHWIMAAIGALGLAVTLPDLPASAGWLLLGMAALAMAYSFPVFPRSRRLRDFGVAKIVTLAMVWTLVTIGLPTLHDAVSLWPWLLVAARRFAFIFAICLVFDIRDQAEDARAGIQTLAVRLGRENSYRLATAAIAAHVGLTILLALCTWRAVNVRVAITLLLIAAIAMGLIAAAKSAREHRLFLTCIDGLMLLQACLVWIAVRGVAL
jgi:1,4-dihydroxy-2-naphthoate octaprenyltransferase